MTLTWWHRIHSFAHSLSYSLIQNEFYFLITLGYYLLLSFVSFDCCCCSFFDCDSWTTPLNDRNLLFFFSGWYSQLCLISFVLFSAFLSSCVNDKRVPFVLFLPLFSAIAVSVFLFFRIYINFIVDFSIINVFPIR